MRSISASPSPLRRAAAAVSVVALGLATFAPTQAAAGVHPDGKRPTINTYKSWDGNENFSPFGCPNTTTYGQVITVPAGNSTLNKFTFYMSDSDAAGSMVVRGEVYAWNGSTAIGSSIFESAPRTISYLDSLFHKEAFATGGVPVTGGSRYVVFASIDKDYESCSSSTLSWGSVSNVYRGGAFVYQNNAGDESRWTGASWATFKVDLAFKAYLS